MCIARAGDAITVYETADNIYSGTVIEALTDENGIYYWRHWSRRFVLG